MSESEEMYLVTLAALKEAGRQMPVPVSQLAQELSIQPVSANQMIRRLEEAGLVSYQPYRGVTLAPEGERQALRLLRHRRLWEVFLVEHLKLSSTSANELACRLEHIIPDEAAERLADFLGDPAVSPGGKPIPTASADLDKDKNVIPLSQLEAGQEARVVLLQVDQASRNFLAETGLQIDVPIRVLGMVDSGSILVGLEGRRVHLTPELAEGIWVTASESVSPAQTVTL
jgi:DtxR family Mn-dependent transcriptional regulator